MPIYKTNGKTETGGQTIGILCVGERPPFVAGDLNDASSFPFPVKYRRIPGMCSADALGSSTAALPGMVNAARELEAEGVRGILSNSALLLQHQQQIANAVRIPVATSSLLQLPLIASSIAPEQTIGILAAATSQMSVDLIRAARIDVCNPLAIYRLQTESIAQDTDEVTADVLRASRQLMAEHPGTGAIILECSSLGPYARKVQKATGLPVFDTLTLAGLLFDITHPRRYQGYI